MNDALKNFTKAEAEGRVASPQTERTPGRSDEVRNNEGGFVFKVSARDRLERFLILGTDGGTFYVGQKELTKDNVSFVRSMIARDERLVVDTLVDVSVNGRAYQNTPAIFTLALVLTEGQDKAYAREAVNKVVRTGTHVFEFAEFLSDLGGWGRAKRKALAGWYTDQDAGSLAYQAVKYRQRNGWTHRDVFRVAHPQGVSTSVGNFILGKSVNEDSLEILRAFQRMQDAKSVTDVYNVLDSYKSLPWETIPTQFLKDAGVWKRLFYNGQLNGQALIRNITRLARINAFNDLQFVVDYAARLTDEEMIARTRLHPVNFLNASVVHSEGRVDRSYSWSMGRNKDWNTVPQIVDALNEGFHLSFKHVEPAGKRTGIFIDTSGSMTQVAMGLDLSCCQVSAAIAMTIARTEPMHVIKGFSSGRYGRVNDGLQDLNITAKTPLAQAVREAQNANWGSTDCSLPMVWAKEHGVELDTFVVITDNETYAGRIKPFQALKRYRKDTGIDARLAVLGVSSTGFTIADPSDRGMMDFVGFDSNAPRALADFSAGRI